jgi:hypothetical protein
MRSPTHHWAVRSSVAAFVTLVLVAGTALAQDTLRTASVQPARVIGRVTDTAGVRLTGAEISVLQSELRTLSDDSGDFSLDAIPSGIVVFSVRRLGYEAATFTAVLKPGKAHRVTFSLNEVAQELPGMTVREQGLPTGWLAVFEKRRTTNRGTFFTRKDIEKRSARVASDVMRLVPGVQVVQTRMGQQLMMTRGAGARRCFPQLYVHSTPYSGMIDDFPASDIEAIEVYSGISEIPAELNTMGRPVCAAVVIWTREPPKKRG